MFELICFLTALTNIRHSPFSSGFVMTLCVISATVSITGGASSMLAGVLVFAALTAAIPSSRFDSARYLLWFCCLGGVGFVASSFGTNAYTVIAGLVLLAASIYCIQMASNYERAERTTSSN